MTFWLLLHRENNISALWGTWRIIMSGQIIASLLSLCMTKWPHKWQRGWCYVRSNTKNAKSLMTHDLHLYYLFLILGGYFSGTQPARLVRSAIITLCRQLKDQAVSLIDVFAPPDAILNSPIGSSDGKVCCKDLRGNPKPRVFPDRTETGPGSGNIFKNIYGPGRVGEFYFGSVRVGEFYFRIGPGRGIFLPGYETFSPGISGINFPFNLKLRK